tara:strand:- start:1731 stop:1832 length:102 start_codon:yes stop_codon:yes gene_type:complete
MPVNASEDDIDQDLAARNGHYPRLAWLIFIRVG